MDGKFSKDVYDFVGTVEKVMREGILELKDDVFANNSEASSGMRNALLDMINMLGKVQRTYARLDSERQKDPLYKLPDNQLKADVIEKNINIHQTLGILHEIHEHKVKQKSRQKPKTNNTRSMLN